MFGKKVKTTCKIEGMQCQHCANKVKNALEALEGVKKVTVHLEEKEVILLSKTSIKKETLEKAITDLDYTLISVVEE